MQTAYATIGNRILTNLCTAALMTVTTESEFKSGSLHQNDYLIYPVSPGLGMPQGIISIQSLLILPMGGDISKLFDYFFLEDHLRFVGPDHRGSITGIMNQNK